MKFVRQTASVCPVCLKSIPASLIEKENKIFMAKKCEEHGEFEDLYYGDASLYHSAMKYYHTGSGVTNPINEFHGNCPHDCGICDNHKSSPIIGIIDVTNRCNLKCPVCFANCDASELKYEPSIDEIFGMMDTLRNANPPCPIILFSGGEPTVREDLPEICKVAHEKGFSYIIIATNGKRLADEPDYHGKLSDAYVDLIYLQFDGVTPEPYEKLRGLNLLPAKIKALENIKNSNKYPSVVLVPTLVKNINDHQIGDIIRFAMKNKGVVKGVLFQPISFTGRVVDDKLQNERITNADGIIAIEKSFEGVIDRNDFAPISWLSSVTDMLRISNRIPDSPELSTYPVCMALAYLLVFGDKITPISRVLNLEELNHFIKSISAASKTEISQKLLMALPKIIRAGSIKLTPKIIGIIKDIILSGTLETATKFQDENVMFIGFDHPMDALNYDTQKTERCFIQYATPDGRLIPFCSYNIFHREKVESNYYNSLTK